MDISKIDWRPKLPQKKDFGIGIIGCWGIVQYAHLPAYQKAGFNVVACYDINKEAAEALATQWSIPKAIDRHREIHDLLRAFLPTHLTGLGITPDVPCDNMQFK